METTIVVINYNTSEETNKCLASIDESVTVSFDCVLIDNDSVDEDYEKLDNYSWLEKIRLDSNIGFARGCNRGAAEAKGDYLFFLNSDAIITEGCISKLINGLKTDDDAKAAVPQVRFEHSPNLIDKGGGAIDTLGFGWHPEHLQEANTCSTSIEETAWGSGCALLVEREAFNSVGGFDSDFFMYEEDKDLCLRLRRCGWKTLYLPDTVVYHKHSASIADKDALTLSPFQIKYKSRNRAKILSKNYPALQLLRYIPLIVGSFLYWNYELGKKGKWKDSFSEVYHQLSYLYWGYKQREPLSRKDWEEIVTRHSLWSYCRMSISQEELYSSDDISNLTE